MDIDIFKEIEVGDFFVEVEATFRVYNEEYESLGALRLTPGQGGLPKVIQDKVNSTKPEDVFSGDEVFAFAEKIRQRERKRGGY